MGVAWGTASRCEELAMVGTVVTGFMGLGCRHKRTSFQALPTIPFP